MKINDMSENEISSHLLNVKINTLETSRNILTYVSQVCAVKIWHEKKIRWKTDDFAYFTVVG